MQQKSTLSLAAQYSRLWVLLFFFCFFLLTQFPDKKKTALTLLVSWSENWCKNEMTWPRIAELNPGYFPPRPFSWTEVWYDYETSSKCWECFFDTTSTSGAAHERPSWGGWRLKYLCRADKSQPWWVWMFLFITHFFPLGVKVTSAATLFLLVIYLKCYKSVYKCLHEIFNVCLIT